MYKNFESCWHAYFVINTDVWHLPFMVRCHRNDIVELEGPAFIPSIEFQLVIGFLCFEIAFNKKREKNEEEEE